MSLNLKIAELYADVVVKTSQLDTQLTAIYSKVNRFDLPPLMVDLDSSAFDRQMDAIRSKLEATRKIASAKIAAPTISAPKVVQPAASATDAAAPAGQIFSLAKLQAQGLKYQDALQREADKVAEATRRANDKVEAAERSSREKLAKARDAWEAREVARIRKEAQSRRDAVERMRPSLADETIEDPTRVFDPFDGPERLAGKDRAAAKFRLGMGGLNIAQDTIQGGSLAYGVNNVLGMAGDKGIQSLLSEGIAAAGGMKVLAAGLGTVAIAATGAFLTIDQGLKSAKLDWADFGNVVGNLAPIHAAGEALSGIGTTVEGIYKTFGETVVGAGLIAAVGSIGDSLGTAVGFIDDWTIGWGRATDAAKIHKDQVEGMTRAAKEYNEAVKNIGRFKSDEQKEKAKTGELVGDVLADMGGDGGADALAARLAAQATKEGGDQKVKIKDEKGKDIEVTRREAVKRDFLTDMNRATTGDPNAIGRLGAGIAGLGLDPGRFNAAAKGVDQKAEASSKIDREADEAWDATQQSIAEMRDYQKKARDREMEILESQAEQNRKAWDAQVSLASKTQSFRLPGGADGKGGLNPAEMEAKRQNDIAVAESRLFQVSNLTMAGGSTDWAKQLQQSETQRGHEEENAKNLGITAQSVKELLEAVKRGGGPNGAAARALLGPA